MTPGIAAGIALALAAYFSKEALGEDHVKQWVRARSTAEALKAETYLFRAGVPPYDGPDDGKRLTEAVAGIEKNVEDLPAVTITSDARREKLPDGPLTMDAYITERVDEAVDGFYVPRAAEHERSAGLIRTISVSLGAAAAVLGVFSASRVAAWVAVITTVMAALAAYLYAQRYQYLITSYQAAARRLASLKTEWLVSGKTESDTRERTEYVRAFEETISVENSAWMAKLPEKKPQ